MSERIVLDEGDDIFSLLEGLCERLDLQDATLSMTGVLSSATISPEPGGASVSIDGAMYLVGGEASIYQGQVITVFATVSWSNRGIPTVAAGLVENGFVRRLEVRIDRHGEADQSATAQSKTSRSSNRSERSRSKKTVESKDSDFATAVKPGQFSSSVDRSRERAEEKTSLSECQVSEVHQRAFAAAEQVSQSRQSTSSDTRRTALDERVSSSASRTVEPAHRQVSVAPAEVTDAAVDLDAEMAMLAPAPPPTEPIPKPTLGWGAAVAASKAAKTQSSHVSWVPPIMPESLSAASWSSAVSDSSSKAEKVAETSAKSTTTSEKRIPAANEVQSVSALAETAALSAPSKKVTDSIRAPKTAEQRAAAARAAFARPSNSDLGFDIPPDLYPGDVLIHPKFGRCKVVKPMQSGKVSVKKPTGGFIDIAVKYFSFAELSPEGSCHVYDLKPLAR